MSSPVSTDTTVVLTSRGRTRLQDRLDRALDRAAMLATRIANDPDQRHEDVVTHRQVTAEIADLRRALEQATMVTDVDEDPQIVELGDEVDVEFDDGDRETYILVHPLEASTDDASISIDSPLSQALLGRRPGDRVSVDAPAGAYTCTIRARRRAR